jgi:hypothetical protein
LGGGGAALRASREGVAASQRAGQFLFAWNQLSLDGALGVVGLEALAGKDVLDVVSGLIDFVGGSGDSLESAAAREAAIRVLRQVIDPQEPPHPTDPLELDLPAVTDLLEQFIAEYIFQRILQVIASRLAEHASGPRQARAEERVIRSYVRARVRIAFANEDPTAVDWMGESGRTLIERAFADAFDVFLSDDEP